jgi:lysophospholipase L1-like esterase
MVAGPVLVVLARRLPLVVATTLLLGSCANGPDPQTSAASASSTAPSSPPPSSSAPLAATSTPPSAEDGLHLVALGDSISTTNECPGCTAFPDRYAAIAQHATGESVDVTNLSVPGAEVADLLKQVTEDQATRTALADADIVTLTVGLNDTPWNRLDDPCQAAGNYPVIRWERITPKCTARVSGEFARSLDKVLSGIEKVRGPGPVVLRITTVYNAVIGDSVDPGWDAPAAVAPSQLGNQSFARIQCEVVAKHGGKCAEMIPLLNGAHADQDAGPYLADHTHLNQQGHNLTARALADLGWEQLQLP